MNTLITAAYLFFSLLSVLLLGTYFDRVLHCGCPVEIHQWVITIALALFFFLTFLNRYKEHETKV